MTRSIHNSTVPALTPALLSDTDAFIYERGLNIGRALHPFDPAATAAEVDAAAEVADEAWMRLYQHAIAEGIRDDAHLEVTA